MSKDYYKTLGVSRSSTPDELKKAYRKLAKEIHPDRNKGNKTAEKKFKEISEAYECLSDPKKKQMYDQFGSEAYQQTGGQGGFGAGFNQGAAGGFGDIFEEMFEGVFGGAARRQSRANIKQPGSDIRFDVSITLEEAFSGVEKTLKFSANSACDSCNGTGSKDGAQPATCHTCRGSGRTRVQQGMFVLEKTCSTCNGAGMTMSNPCGVCRGEGRFYKQRSVNAKIPKGIDDGMKVRLAGHGESGIRGGPPGDLYIYVSVKPHKIFKREGNNVVCKVPIPMVTVALGGEVDVPTIDGKSTVLKIPAGTQPNTRIKIRSKGMTIVGRPLRGDMYVEVNVETPVNLSAKQKTFLENFRKEEVNNSPQSSGFFKKMKEFFTGG